MIEHRFRVEVDLVDEKSLIYTETIEDPANEYSAKQAFELLCKKIHQMGVVYSEGTINSLGWVPPEQIKQVELLSYRIVQDCSDILRG